MQTLAEIRELLSAYGLAPRKSLGQNFLIDHNLIRRLVDVSGVGAGDVVLEVGPGTGALTTELLSRGCIVVASELDRGLARLLRETIGAREPGRFTLVEGDCLESKRELSFEVAAAIEAAMAAAGVDRFRLVANLPYGAATPLMLHLLTARPSCSGLFVTIQREVAERLEARPGSKAYGAISVVAQSVCEVGRVANLPSECFWPRPDVVSCMSSLRRLDEPLTSEAAGLGRFAQALFAERRKQLGSVLRRHFGVEASAVGVEPTARAEQLGPEAIVGLMARVRAHGTSGAIG